MSIYSLDGIILLSAHSETGENLQKAYNMAGVEIFSETWAKTFSVLGDSYSTFAGDVYPSTNRVWYDGTKNGVTNKDMTWYRLLAESTGMTLYRNASFSGSPICYDGWGEGTTDSNQSAFVSRYSDVGNADIIFVFGGTNDSWIGVPQGEYRYSDWTESDLESFRPALACLFYRLKTTFPESTVIFIKNTGLTSAIQNSISVIAAHYSVPVIELSDITKTDGHPTNVGMAQISTQVETYLRANNLIGA